MAGNFDFLHIKRRTAGSSNELSFDVLEHKSVVADGHAQRGSNLPKAPKASQGTYHGVAGTATFSGQPEVEKRKKARRSHRVRMQVVVAVLVVGLVAAGALAANRYLEEKANVSSRIHALVDRLSEVDESLAEIDTIIIDPLNPETAAERSQLQATMPKLTTELNRISVDAQSLLELSLDEREEVVLGQINASAQSRSSMISSANDAFSLSNVSSEQAQRANAVWNDVLDADQQARDGIAAANRATTQEPITQALDQVRDAQQSLELALGQLNDMSAEYGIDFSKQAAYLSKKVEALGYAAQTSEALVAGDREAAHQASEAYDDADEAAVALAEEVPASISDTVESGFTQLMLSHQKSYEEARERTVQADSVIREYLGHSG